MKIFSWNVNGIRACQKKGFDTWLNTMRPDIVCLQETKAQDEQIPNSLQNHPDYHLFHSAAEKKGYSGVAIMCRQEPINITIGLGVEKFDCEGRTLIAEYSNFYLINGYFPNGQRDHSRVDFKLEYSQLLLDRALKLESHKPVIIAGDFNTAHHPIDLANPKSNSKTTGFLPKERAWLDHLINSGYCDIFRKLNPQQTGHYSWWTYRGDCRQRNIGWRIDYFFIAQSLINQVQSAQIHPQVMGSDHCPISLQLKH